MISFHHSRSFNWFIEMKYFTLKVFVGVIAVFLFACHGKKPVLNPDYTSYVNTLIGTDFTGNTYPGAQTPFGWYS